MKFKLTVFDYFMIFLWIVVPVYYGFMNKQQTLYYIKLMLGIASMTIIVLILKACKVKNG